MSIQLAFACICKDLSDTVQEDSIGIICIPVSVCGEFFFRVPEYPALYRGNPRACARNTLVCESIPFEGEGKCLNVSEKYFWDTQSFPM